MSGPKRPTPFPDGECAQCGQVHVTATGRKSCSGHISVKGDRKGQPCKHEAGWGTDHQGEGTCRKHGGNSPSHDKSAKIKIVEREARKLLGIEGYELVADPYTELIELASELKKLRSVLLEKVEELETLRSYGGVAGEQIDVLFAAYERAADRCERLTLGMARLDLDARLAALHAKIDEKTAELVSTALAGALGSAQIDQDTHATIMREFGNLLRQAPSQMPAIAV